MIKSFILRRLFITISSLFLMGVALYAQNLINNPSFEHGTGNIPSSWHHPPSTATILYAWEEDIAQTGNHSLSIQKTDENNHAIWLQNLDPEVNKYYNFSVFGKAGANTLRMDVIIRFWDNGQIESPPAIIKSRNVYESKWSELSFQFYLPPDIDSIQVLLELGGRTGKIYFDDVTLTLFDPPQSDLIAFNCGSSDFYFNSPDSILYFPDREYSPGNGTGYINSSDPPENVFGFDIIGGTEGRLRLYNQATYGFDGYRFDVENGTYAVRLHFCENEYHWKDKRIQNISIEDITVLENFNIYRQVGRNYAIVYSFPAEVVDGQLNVTALGLTGNTLISAISVEKTSPDTTAPVLPEAPAIISGFAQVILNWKPNFKGDMKGYNIYRKSAGTGFELLNDSPHPLSRYIDNEVAVDQEYQYRITSVDLWGNESQFTETMVAVPVGDEVSNLPVFELLIDEVNLAKLNSDIFSDEYVMADFIYNDSIWKNVGVRFRGNVTQKLSKKNYKIRFNEDELFHGMEKLNLNATMNDPSLIIDATCYSLRRDAGVLTQDTYPVHLNLNGNFIGVYFQREQEDNNFLQNHNLPDANIYRSQSGNFRKLPASDNYIIAYEKENNEAAGYRDLIDFIEFINDSRNEEFKNKLPGKFNVGEFLTAYAVLNCVADIDQHFHNFLLFHSLQNDKWRICNWDHNTTFRDPQTPIDLYTVESPSPIGHQYNYLFNRMFHIDEFRYYYIHRLLELTDSLFSPAEMQIRLEDYHNLISFDAERDIYKNGWESNELFLNQLENRINWVQERVDFIRAEAPAFLPADYDPLQGISINEILTGNDALFADENGDFLPWIELYNDGIIPVDISGCYLSDDYQDHTAWQFPQGIVIQPKEYLIIWMDGNPPAGNLHTSLQLNTNGGEIALFTPDQILLDTISYGLQSDNVSYARNGDGNPEWILFDYPTPDAPNRVPASIPPVFINEFSASNDIIIHDESGNYEDWVELYNNSEETVNIGGYHLTDDLNSPMKWEFFNPTEIPPFGFLLVWTDGDPDDGIFHTSFKLSQDGEEIGLYTPDGKIAVDTISFGPQQTDISLGRIDDGNPEWILFLSPTPGLSNTSTGLQILSGQQEQFYLGSGYPNPFTYNTTIPYGLPVACQVKVLILNSHGKTIRILCNKRQLPGTKTICWDGTDESGRSVPPGIYFVSIEAGDYVKTNKIVLTK